jgi:hypothetical protein
MIKETVKYTDFNGVEKTEEFWFHLSKTEIGMMQMTSEGTFADKLQSMIGAKSMSELAKTFREVVLASYGVKTDDGRGFIKVKNGVKLSEEFEQTAAYDALFMSLLMDEKRAADFINGILPADVQNELAASRNEAKNVPAPVK